ncbi:Zn-ribbon domain-containing OB-fold protein [Paraburkholderia sp. GAS334]|uniref:Zn-ribbon domain-containing OB-fold protein n=1 Tax=Paraburkholderia sp. GAS334 TaxID=3035131 RepID=UPI003D25F454
MPNMESTRTSGAAYANDALPFKDLEEPKPAQFIKQDGIVLLKGSVSRSSGYKAFPERDVCPQTGARDMRPTLFGPHGTLYSYSSVHVSSTRATPYAIGYVDFPEGVRVLANVESPAALKGELSCDIPVELRAEGDRWFVVPLVGQQDGVSA